MLINIQTIRDKFANDIKNVKTQEDLEKVRAEFTGRTSPLMKIMGSMNTFDAETKKIIGAGVNELRIFINETINEIQDTFTTQAINKQLETEKIDVTLPSNKNKFGTLHPLNIVIEELGDIFRELGFEMVDGTEVEKDLYNFQMLNLPIGHPARDMQDTFYINDETVMRTHCTNMSARMMEEQSKKHEIVNIASISFGNVYRRDDDDATHSHQFMQADGFAVGQKISFVNLKWTLKYMCQRLFDNNVEIRMRPSFFPFTEPSVEVDVSCFRCKTIGCAICKHSGWIEILGAGMFNQQVLGLCNIDPKKHTALAFGIGIERIAMLKFGITNIRNFYENNIEFLEQFKFYSE